MDSDQLGSFIALAAVLVALLVYLHTMKRDAAVAEARTGQRFDELRGELRDEIGTWRAETRDGFAKVGAQLAVLEARTYDLGRALPPPPVEPHVS